MVKIGNDWDELLKDEWSKAYYRGLRDFLIDEYKNETVYPPAEDIYNALRITPYFEVKVVILGQDPYHEPGQAQGLAFSVPDGVPLPPSLVNIYKEMSDDLKVPAPEMGDLTHWAEQGVLLLNTVLTVRAHQAGSHRGAGWEQFTDKVIELLAARSQPMVFVLWGANAIAKKELIIKASEQNTDADNNEGIGSYANSAASRRHLIITAPHPSPLSAYRGFFGGRYFSRCNYFLEDNGLEAIAWAIKNP